MVGLLLACQARIGDAQVPRVLLARTIVARETDSWSYIEGKMQHGSPTFGLTYSLTDSSLIRRTVKNLQTGEVLTDDSEYIFVRNLISYRQALGSLCFRRLTPSERGLIPAIRALGQPGSDAVETLWIGPDWMQSVRTVSGYMVISRYSRSQ